MRSIMSPSFILLFIFAHSVSSAQFLSKTSAYGGVGNEYGGGVIASPDGGHIMVGSTSSYGPNAMSEEPNAYVVKLDPSGGLDWSLALGGTGSDWYSDAAATASGFIAIGSTFPQGPMTIGNMLVTAFDHQGQVLWNKRIGSSSHSEFASRIRSIGDDKYVIVGSRSLGAGGSQSNMFAMCINSLGEMIWLSEFGSSSGDNASDLVQLPDGGFMIVGMRYIPTSRLQIVRLNAQGQLVWDRSFTGEVQNFGWKIDIVGDDVLLVGGHANKLLAMRLDQNGEVQWEKLYSSEWTISGRVLHVLPGDEGVILAGSTYSPDFSIFESVLIKISPQGDLLEAERSTDGMTAIRTITPSDGGGLLVAGDGSPADGVGFSDMIANHRPGEMLGFGCSSEPVDIVMEDMEELPFQSLMSQEPQLSWASVDLSWSPVTAGEEAVLCSNVGIEEPSDYVHQLVLFPNPSRQYVKWVTFGIPPFSLEITDRSGRVVYQRSRLQVAETLLPYLATGMYHCKVISNEGSMSRGVLMIHD